MPRRVNGAAQTTKPGVDLAFANCGLSVQLPGWCAGAAAEVVRRGGGRGGCAGTAAGPCSLTIKGARPCGRCILAQARSFGQSKSCTSRTIKNSCTELERAWFAFGVWPTIPKGAQMLTVAHRNGRTDACGREQQPRRASNGRTDAHSHPSKRAHRRLRKGAAATQLQTGVQILTGGGWAARAAAPSSQSRQLVPDARARSG